MVDSTKKISFIIPVFNTDKKYLKKCVDSIYVLSQYVSIEIQLINDGSTNRETLETLDGYANQPYINVVSTSNKGPASARNIGINNANGKYIAFVDSDDFIFYDAFIEGLRLIEKGGFDILCFTYQETDEYGQIIRRGKESKEIFTFNYFKELINVRDKYGDTPDFAQGVVWGKIYSKSALLNVRFDEELQFCEDNIFNTVIEKQGVRLVGINCVGYNHSTNLDSLCHKYNPYASKLFAKSISKLQILLDSRDVDAMANFSKTVIFNFYMNHILLLEVFNNQNRESLYKKEKHAKYILHSQPYFEFFKGLKLKKLSKRQRIIFLLLKFNMFWFAYIINKL